MFLNVLYMCVVWVFVYVFVLVCACRVFCQFVVWVFVDVWFACFGILENMGAFERILKHLGAFLGAFGSSCHFFGRS